METGLLAHLELPTYKERIMYEWLVANWEEVMEVLTMLGTVASAGVSAYAASLLLTIARGDRHWKEVQAKRAAIVRFLRDNGNTPNKFLASLNELGVIFDDVPDMENAMKDLGYEVYLNGFDNRSEMDRLIIELARAMYKDVGLKDLPKLYEGTKWVAEEKHKNCIML